MGSNLGDRGENLRAALSEIAQAARLLRVSSFYLCEPVGFRDQPDFWNAVAEIQWPGSARSLLRMVREVERRVGRKPTFANGPREIDVDILDFAGTVRTEPDPVLPHPRLSCRRFVVAPLAELNPLWTDPVSGRTARELLAAIPKKPAARRIAARRTRQASS